MCSNPKSRMKHLTLASEKGLWNSPRVFAQDNPQQELPVQWLVRFLRVVNHRLLDDTLSRDFLVMQGGQKGQGGRKLQISLADIKFDQQ